MSDLTVSKGPKSPRRPGHADLHPAPTFDYTHSLERLVGAQQQLAVARSLSEIQKIVRSTARALLASDGATFVLRDQQQCHYVDEDAIAPLWKGSRFPMEMCISGWSMLNKAPAIIPHVYADARIPHEAYLPTFVQSLVMVPINQQNPIGAIGVYWAHQHHATPEQVHLLQTLADATAIALETNHQLEGLEERVQARTAELQVAHDEIQQQSLTDELTGAYNRRGFYLMAQQALKQAARQGSTCALAYIDLDGLKLINDQHGHDAGDVLLTDAATVLDDALRETDIIARMGGDEFCVFAVDPGDLEIFRNRLQHAFDTFNQSAGKHYTLAASIGIAHGRAIESSLNRMLSQADHLMYAQKQTRPRPSARNTG